MVHCMPSHLGKTFIHTRDKPSGTDAEPPSLIFYGCALERETALYLNLTSEHSRIIFPSETVSVQQNSSPV